MTYDQSKLYRLKLYERYQTTWLWQNVTDRMKENIQYGTYTMFTKPCENHRPIHTITKNLSFS